jgi:hypothetical protein
MCEIRNMGDTGVGQLYVGNTALGGSLSMGANEIQLVPSSGKGGRIRGHASDSRVEFRNSGGSGSGQIDTSHIYCTGNIFMSSLTTVDGRDISAMVRAKVLVGQYTGDAADNRDINIGVDLTAKSNVFVFVKDASANRSGMFRPELAQGDLGQFMIALADAANSIQALTATGFQVGNLAEINQAAEVFRYVVFYEEP